MADKNENTKGGEGNESNSQKTDPKPQPFDTSKLSDEDFAKVFDDERLWKHERFKELTQNAKSGKEALDKLKQLEEKNLEKQGKYKELAEKHKQEAEEAKKQLQEQKIANAIQAEASKQGAQDSEAVLALIDRSKISVDDDGKVTGVDQAVTGLLEAKSYLKGGNSQSNVNIGSPTNPGSNPNAAKKFTLSQIQDPTFYRENEADIMDAYKHGNIVDDVGGSSEGPQNPQS